MNQMNKDSNSINITGLTDEEVRQRVEEGFTNRTDISTDKTTKEIVISNVFTYFNLIFLVITILLIMVGSFRNLTFLPIIIGNTVIGIVQEIRAKKTLEKMSLLNAPHADVIRNGSVKQISTEKLVKDDVILLTAGKQICADAVVISGNIQVNESLLTGEADEVEKTEGSTLMSGSFVVSGECYARLEKVGNESYISKLSLEAKSMGGKEQSEMIRSINLIVKWVGIVIIPIGLILFWQSHFVNGESITKSVTSTVAAIIGMIPEGLYLLTTVALALSTMKLARKKVLLHDMKSIETLARVDVLCVDKTGTITEPDMKLKEIIKAAGKSAAYLEPLLKEMANVGLVEFNWENPEHEKQYVLPMFVPGSTEFFNMKWDNICEHPQFANFFERMTQLPLEAIRRQIASGVDILVHLGRMRDKSRKVLEITEVCGFEDHEIKTRTLYRWQEGKGLVQTAELLNREKLVRAGVEI